MVIDNGVYSKLVSDKKRYLESIMLANSCRLLCKKATFPLASACVTFFLTYWLTDHSQACIFRIILL